MTGFQKDILRVAITRLFNEQVVQVTKTEYPHIFRFDLCGSQFDNDFHLKIHWFDFEDETQNYFDGFFHTLEEAKECFDKYCEEYL